uniref:Uncharacterized protein n=1 Tax=Chelonoidis abingdonii TaxID=106734 RepID=A0A8C0GYV9_CHEAB
QSPHPPVQGDFDKPVKCLKPLRLIVIKGSLPKPSISVSPGGVIPVRGNVTIRCRHQRLGMRFLLYKDGDGDYLTNTDPAGSEAEFPITSARREHGGGPPFYEPGSSCVVKRISPGDKLLPLGGLRCQYNPPAPKHPCLEDPPRLLPTRRSHPRIEHLPPA